MGDRPNPFPPTSAGAALPTDVIADYPGPAARADAAGRIVAVNPVAAAFLPVGAAWSDVDSRGEPLPQTGSITQFGEPADHIVIQWVAVPLPGGETVLFGIDATLDTNLRRALAESRRRFRDLAELAGDFAWETDRDGCLTYVSVNTVLGHRADALIGRPAADLLAADVAGVDPFSPRRQIRDVPVWLWTADGGQVCTALSARPIFDETGIWAGGRGIGVDITERRAREAHLARLHERDRLVGAVAASMRGTDDPNAALSAAMTELCRAISADTMVALVVDDAAGARRVCRVGGAAADLDNGLTQLAATVVDQPDDLVRTTPQAHLVALHCGTLGRNRGVLVALRPSAGEPFADPDVALAQAAAPQIAYGLSQVMEQALLRRQADHDPLTGLLNRAALSRRLAERLAEPERGPSTLLYVDLDNFKAVNDTNGHAKGDAALIRVSGIFRSFLHDGDLAGRMGGDEFVIWLADRPAAAARDAAVALVGAGRGLGDLSASSDRPLGLSIGVALIRPELGEGVDSVIERADAAMYAAKRVAKQTRTQGGWAMAAGDAVP